MSLIWADIQEIAIGFAEAHEDIDPHFINFMDLRTYIIELPNFSDDPKRCGEKILEAIQSAWIEEIE